MTMTISLEDLDIVCRGKNDPHVMLINKYHGPLPAEILLQDNSDNINKEEK